VDGRGYAGKVEEITLPKLTVKTDEFRAGGMDCPVEIDMGMEKLECDFSLRAVDADVLKLWGIVPGNTQTRLTFRGSLRSEDGVETGVIANIEGKVKEADYGAWKAGEPSTLKCAVACVYYKLTHGGQVIHEIDVRNMKRIVNGQDQLAAMRAALGV
jgi:hypothetical protein